MGNSRKHYSSPESMVLVNEVGGHCPLCDRPLIVTKTRASKKSTAKIFQIAHIYPLNPTPQEVDELKEEPRLSNDVNDISNVIAVCPTCHSIFDNPRTREEYRKWYGIKKNLLEKTKTKELYSQFSLEGDIREILERMNVDFPESDLASLDYAHLRLNEKLNDTTTPLTKRTIRGDVVNYYSFIENCFIGMEAKKPGKSEQIAIQIKYAYLKLHEQHSNQEVVYTALIDWLHSKTDQYSRQACAIIISFFIQSCEVFSDNSK